MIAMTGRKPLNGHQLTSRSNSDLLRIKMVADDVNSPVKERMAEIYLIAAEWYEATYDAIHRSEKLR